ncbi:hypothetical protein [Vibrio breoganii]|nr:hypothetical protein [Vibrio breoganii]
MLNPNIGTLYDPAGLAFHWAWAGIPLGWHSSFHQDAGVAMA